MRGFGIILAQFAQGAGLLPVLQMTGACVYSNRVLFLGQGHAKVGQVKSVQIVR